MATRWTPSIDVQNYVCNSPLEIRGMTTSYLWEKSKFYYGKQMFGMSGITWSRKKIMFSTELVENGSPKSQASIIYHELVHVAQQLDWGWFKFMAKYVEEWITAGCKYENMKKSGIEREAYRRQELFDESMRYL